MTLLLPVLLPLRELSLKQVTISGAMLGHLHQPILCIHYEKWIESAIDYTHFVNIFKINR
jgi:hypothetical protein